MATATGIQWRTKLSGLASSLLPGVFMVGYVIGTGSVTTMAAAGASYGMSLLWTLVLASFFTHIMFSAISKMTMVSGRTMLWLFREQFGAPVTLLLMIGMMVTQIASIIGVMGILTDVMHEWSRPLTPSGTGLNRVVTGVVFMLILLFIFWNGHHRFFLKAVSVLVAMMGISFVLTACLVPPPASSVVSGLLPRIPQAGEPHLLIAGMVGTTLASVCLFSRSIVVHEEGWKPSQLGVAYRDSFVSAVLLLVINASIMAAAAGTLYKEGKPVQEAIDMVKTLEPLAGRFASTAFVVGIVAAGLSSLFPNYILGTWLLSDFLNCSREPKQWHWRALVLATASFSLVVPVFGGRPVQIMIASQAVSPLVMPLMTLFTWLALVRAGRSGQCHNSPWIHGGLGLTLLFTLYMLGVAVLGFLRSGPGF